MNRARTRVISRSFSFVRADESTGDKFTEISNPGGLASVERVLFFAPVPSFHEIKIRQVQRGTSPAITRRATRAFLGETERE